MKRIFSKSYKIAMYESQWEYKGHQCRIEIDYERNSDGSVDVAKAYHYVRKPDGNEELAAIDSYDSDPKTVNLWIDAGYPRRQGIGPLNKEQLQKMVSQPQSSPPSKMAQSFSQATPLPKNSLSPSIGKFKQIKQLLDEIRGDTQAEVDEAKKEEVLNWVMELRRTLDSML